jgi:hypothetical protein
MRDPYCCGEHERRHHDALRALNSGMRDLMIGLFSPMTPMSFYERAAEVVRLMDREDPGKILTALPRGFGSEFIVFAAKAYIPENSGLASPTISPECLAAFRAWWASV